MKPWYQQPYRMVQTNLRMTDALMDPRAVARQAREFGATVLLFNIGGIFAFYPTELPLHARNPMLKGDLLGEIIEAAHSEGLRLVGRFDLSKSTRKTYEEHPDWFVHNRQGAPIEYNGTYQACVNGGWYQGYAHKIIREALGRYDVDAVFFNMFGYRSSDYSGKYHGICACQNCRDRFRSMYDRELPVREDFSDPSYADYLAFTDSTSIMLGDDIYRTVKSARPSVAVMGQRTTCDLMRMEIQRAVGRPAPEWPYQAGEQARWAAAFGRGKTFGSTSANFIDYAWRFVAETGACQVLRFAQQLASGAVLDYYLVGTFDQDDEKAFPEVQALFAWHAANVQHYAGLRNAARIGLYQSRKTATYREATLTSAEQTACFRGAYRALVEERLPFDFVPDERMLDDDAMAQLSRYDVIVMPNVACLGDAEAAVLDAWVAAGGTLLATGETGLYDDRGAPRGGFVLDSMPATKVQLARANLRSYFELVPGEVPSVAARLMMLDGRYFQAETKDGTETLLHLLPEQRFGPPELCYPELGATHPGILVRAHGEGRVIYMPWLPEWHYHRDSLPDHRALITDLVKRHATPQLRLEGVGPVELTLQRQADSGELLVHIINYSGQRNNLYEAPVTLTGLRLGIRGASGPAHALVAGVEIESAAPDADGLSWITLPPVGAFEVVKIAQAEATL
jgi:hypothetical protein